MQFEIAFENFIYSTIFGLLAVGFELPNVSPDYLFSNSSALCDICHKARLASSSRQFRVCKLSSSLAVDK